MEEVEGRVIVCDIFPMIEDRGHSLMTINITWRELLGLLYCCTSVFYEFQLLTSAGWRTHCH